MAYSDFNLSKVKEDFQLNVREIDNLFSDVSPVQPSDFLVNGLVEFVPLATAIGTEKARSEFIIAQVLSEVRRHTNYQISLFSGSEFNVDPVQGLTGYCDFLLTCSDNQLEITAPVITIVEAKKENIIGGLGQCIAGMVATQIFNEKSAVVIPVIYGAVTSGTNWRFLTLEQKLVSIDRREYYINEISNILSILLRPIDLFLQSN